MVCEFCGNELPTKTRYGLRIPVPCTCEGAVKERLQMDLEEKRDNWKNEYAKALSMTKIPLDYSLYRQWGDNESLYLYGEQGRGKTEMACGAIRKWIKDGIRPYVDENGRETKRFYSAHSGKYVLMPAWIMEVRSSFSSKVITEDDLVKQLGGVGMLVMDDLGKGKMTDWVVEKIFMILDLRFNERKARNLITIITTQYPLDALTSIFESVTDKEMALAIRSRIEGMCVPRRIEGLDMRLS